MEFDSDIPLDYDSDDLQTLGASDADFSGASQSDGNEGGSAGAERSVHSEGLGRAEGSNRAASAEQGGQAPSRAPSVHSGQSGRQRGSRGGASRAGSHGSGGKAKTAKWRSGAIPPAPPFEGDIDVDPFCLRHYKKRLMRWCLITAEFLPKNEQALRAREQLRGEAELELSEIADERYNKEDGIQQLLNDLEESFGEKPLFRQGGVIREYESIGRLQGENITAFVRRFRLLERKLKDNGVPTYPEESRVIKLLDGLRLDERATAQLLLAAGNKYEMRAILDAIKIQYPAGMSITGLPNTKHGKKTSSFGSRRSQKPVRRNWNTFAEDDYEATYDYDETAMPNVPDETYEDEDEQAHEYEQTI